VFFLDYILRTLYVLVRPYDPETLLHPEILNPQIRNAVLMYLGLGVFCFLNGYYSQIPTRLANRLPSLRHSWLERGLLGKAMLLYVVGIAATLYGYSHGFYIGAFSSGLTPATWEALDYVQHFSMYTWYAVFAMLVVSAPRTGAARRLVIYVMLGGVLVQTVLGGSKGLVFSLLFLLLVFYNYRKTRVGIWAYIVGAVVGLLVIFPLLNTYRSTHFSISGGFSLELGTALSDTLVSSYRELASMTPGEYVDNAITQLMRRQHEIDSFATIIAKTGISSPYLLGSDFIWIVPTAVIPRLIWPSKPFPQDGVIFDTEYWSAYPGANAGPPFVGDLYMNFGLPGVIVGMFFLGILCRFVYLYFIKNTGSAAPGLLFYGVLAPELIRMGAEAPASVLSGVLKTGLYLMLFHLVIATRIQGSQHVNVQVPSVTHAKT